MAQVPLPAGAASRFPTWTNWTPERESVAVAFTGKVHCASFFAIGVTDEEGAVESMVALVSPAGSGGCELPTASMQPAENSYFPSLVELNWRVYGGVVSVPRSFHPVPL